MGTRGDVSPGVFRASVFPSGQRQRRRSAARGLLAIGGQRASGGPWPAVIVIHENRGLTDHIKDVARRVANLGYVALAVDYLSRAGGTDKFSAPADPTQAINALKQSDIDSDTVASVAYLKTQS